MRNRILLISGGAVAVIAIVAIVIFTTSSSNSPKASPSSTPAQSLSGTNQPKFYGIDSLIDYGLTTDQVDGIKFAITKYRKTSNVNFTKATVTNITVTHDQDSDFDTANFDLALDSAKLQASVQYYDLTAIRLSIIKNGSTIFQSGDIDLYHGVGN